MIIPQYIKTFPDRYRAKEMQIIADWILGGESGSVVGLAGCGRSNLLNFLSYRPEMLSFYYPSNADPVALIPVDLNHLPANNSSTLYRVLLRSFYWVRERFHPNVRERIARLYLENRATQDPFLSQSALHEMLFTFQAEQSQVVLVLNHFDRFCQEADPRLLNTLRGLRDSFKETLCFIVGMGQEVAYLSDPSVLGDMYELLDSNVCWVGSMTEPDARYVIAQATRTASTPPSEPQINQMLALTGNFPVLLKSIGHWWLQTQLPMSEWEAALQHEHRFEYRVARLWKGLSGEEQFALSAVREWQEQVAKGKGKGSKNALKKLKKEHSLTLRHLVTKGMCRENETGWQISGQLLTDYVKRVGPRGKGRIRLEGKGQILYQGLTRVQSLSPQEEQLLRFLIKHPYERHTYTMLIDQVWSEDEAGKIGITPTNLQQLVSHVRKKIEVNSSDPRYIISWRGVPEGGYQFYPEGRPE